MSCLWANKSLKTRPSGAGAFRAGRETTLNLDIRCIHDGTQEYCSIARYSGSCVFCSELRICIYGWVRI